MATVTVSVGGQSHTIGCGPGEEARVAELAEYVDSRAVELAAGAAQPTYNRLLLMTALMIADDLATALDDVERARESAAADTTDASAAPATAASADPVRMRAIAERLEAYADRLEQA
ncbi:MAG: cell division protein ZapA [Minwuia sp.]|nr:cell division protein ZapA [Minwuia sp.]